MDTPISNKWAKIYANGVSDLCALDDGRLLVLEREAYVASGYIGSWVVNRVYCINTTGPVMPQKKLVAMWRTSLNLIHKDFANYEGMCVGHVSPTASGYHPLCRQSEPEGEIPERLVQDHCPLTTLCQ